MKICKQCGEQFSDDMQVCPKCGAALESVSEAVSAAQEAVAQTAEAVSSMEPAPVPPAAQQVQLEAAPDAESQKKLKMLILAGVGVVALLVLVLIGRALFTSSYKDPLKKTVKFVNSQSTDAEKLLNAAMPKFVVTAYKDALKAIKKFDSATDSTTYDEMMDSMKEGLNDAYAKLEDEFGKNVKLSYKIVEKEKLNTKELKEIANAYKDLAEAVKAMDALVDKFKDTLTDEKQYDMKKKDANAIIDLAKDTLNSLEKSLKNVSITEGYAATIELKMSGKDDEDKEEIEVNIIKMNGKWCIDVLSYPGASDELNQLIKQIKRGDLSF